ncbi:MAG TPA: formate dehydrogenase subunit gamma [Longimicrobiales bacterium]|nr:formate dehydrogenase subunit gamma [Longimicrobiales bacterium]
MRRGEIRRFTYVERVVHWVVGLSFLFLLLTGLAFSHPRLFWITTLVGGGPTARILHPWMGVVFGVSLVAMLAIWAGDMLVGAADREWLRAIRHYAVHDREKVPAAGKYNGGQKLFFWSMGALGVLYVVSGIPIWLPAGFLGLGPFYGTTVNLMRLLHYVATVGGGLLLIVHVYLGTVAYPGTLGGMLHGSVTRAWAKLHHPAWDEGRSER